MKIVRWWVHPHPDFQMNGGYASSIREARKDARALLSSAGEIEPGQHFNSGFRSFDFEVFELANRKSDVIRELNNAVNDGWGGEWN